MVIIAAKAYVVNKTLLITKNISKSAWSIISNKAENAEKQTK